ncbi:uncharacterized protein BP5553_06962 [Venustampulla echinocandica]|uniref:Carrier domain-containing protein n=1 Tax=Venustampulla echinocandica TaxID=2656787 RepID=A0A370TI42_9HELO|nr:uncharacterized protein BP5553_06962 [Venustampulla echinocandica]RDL35031.1 hypothetical protein BP5553_06962 [Venustampulla echinocandica]
MAPSFSTITCFPTLNPYPPYSTHQTATSVVSQVVGADRHSILKASGDLEIEPATFFQAAWSLLLLNYVRSEHVSFVCSSKVTGTTQKCILDFQNLNTVLDIAQQIQTSEPGFTSQGRNELDSGILKDHGFSTMLYISTEEHLSHSLDTTVKHEDKIGVVCRVTISESNVEYSIQSRVSLLSAQHANNLVNTFAKIVEVISDNASSPISVQELDMLSDYDRKKIWNWNADVPSPVNACIHQLVGRQCASTPGAEAVCSWDGNLTYIELDRMTSKLAGELSSFGVRPGTKVPICFHKSKWAVVTMLAILKAGGAFVSMDPSHPASRLQKIIQECAAKIVIVGQSTQSILLAANGGLLNVVVVDQYLLDTIRERHESPSVAADVSPEDPAFVLFTSGSTGTPKGIVVSHRAFCSNASTHIPQFKLQHTSRVLQFAHYTYDVSIGEIFSTLLAGGCICVPSDDDRVNQLPSTVQSLNANWAFFTPTVASLFGEDEIAATSLKVLVLGGEMLTEKILKLWANKVHLINVYGPAECSIYCASNPGMKLEDVPSIVGRALGSRIWIAKSDDHNLLVPIGCIGEILVEGPILAQGYLNDAGKTATAFINSPPWHKAPNQYQRLYKTGDLARYMSDGSIQIVGRKDTQVKLRGQRIELGDIEYNLLQILPNKGWRVVVELIKPAGHPLLVAYVSNGSTTDIANYKKTFIVSETAEITTLKEASLENILPRHMIPTAFIQLSKMPMTSGGKTDRRSLCQLGSALSSSELKAFLRETQTKISAQFPSLERESVLSELWAKALGIPIDSIGADDNFFTLGGDSMYAMKLASASRSLGFILTVADIFSRPSLAQMALRLTEMDSSDEYGVIPPFEMLRETSNLSFDTLGDAAQICKVDKDSLEDIYPCTSLQEGLISLSQIESRAYIGQHVFEIPEEFNISRFQEAWDYTIREHSILRTRFVRVIAFSSLLQVALKNWKIQWIEQSGAVGEYLRQDIQLPFQLGDPMVRFALLKSPDNKSSYRTFIFTAHHAMYDGWSLALLFRSVDMFYRSSGLIRSPPYRNFIQSISNQAIDLEYWKSQLQDAQPASFPRLPYPGYRPLTHSSVVADVKVKRYLHSHITTPTIIRAAWALTLGIYSGSEDVIVGVTVSGRNSGFTGIESITGPTFVTLPVRLQPGRQKVAKDFLSEVQRQSAEMIPLEHTSLFKISRLSPSIRQACEFQNLLVIQPRTSISIQKNESNNILCGLEKLGSKICYTYGIVVECTLGLDGFTVNAMFDEAMLDIGQVERIIFKFKDIAQHMFSGSLDQRLEEFVGVSPHELATICEWNKEVPEPIAMFTHKLISKHAETNPKSQAVSAWDGDLSLEQLDELSSILAAKLISLGVTPETVVSMCFEKSKYAIVSLLAILKAGAVYNPLDPSHPQIRLQAICRQTKARICLTSAQSLVSCQSVFSTCIVIDDSIVQNYKEFSPLAWQSVHITPENAAYVIFTSGSSGEPKGVVIEHKALMLSAAMHGKTMGMAQTTRSIQFSSFTFDISLTDIITTLLYGGCICIPSEDDRMNNLHGAITQFQSNWALLTPSLASTIVPESVPTLKTLVLAGEPMNRSHVQNWAKRVKLINGYGPTECCIFSMVNNSGMISVEPTNIGTAVGAVSWIVDALDYNKLAPIGAVGELLLSGHILARGYLNDPQKSAAAFVVEPAWSQLISPGHRGRFYRTGDLVRYNPDGSITYIGRKDTQVKLHGQRMELGEVEHHLRQILGTRREFVGAAAEIITPKGSHKSFVGAFICFESRIDVREEVSKESVEIITAIFDELRTHMLQVLPQYMVPAQFIPFKSLPLTTAGKLNRQMLRSIASDLTLKSLSRFTVSQSLHQDPQTAMEHRLQNIWSTVLETDKDSIGRHDNFFALGGDSLAALRLVSIASADGLLLTVADVFSHSLLSSMSAHISESIEKRTSDSAVIKEVQVKPDLGKIVDDSVWRGVSVQLSMDSDQIENIYESTDYQGWSTLTSLLKTRGNTNYYIFDFSGPLDPVRLKAACHRITRHHDLLRTVFTAWKRQVLQVVLKSPEISFEYVEGAKGAVDVAKGLMHLDLKKDVRLGDLATWYKLVQQDENHNALLMKVSHAQYDGVSLDQIRENLCAAYSGKSLQTGPSFANFIHYANTAKVESFWRKYLEGSTMPEIINHTGPAYRNVFNCTVKRLIPAVSLSQHGITDSNLVKAAWAYTLARLTRIPDVVFAVLVSGRNVPIQGISKIGGPTINYTPWRIKMKNGCTPMDICRSVQEQQVTTMPYESTYYRRIIERYTTWPKWTRFTSIVHHMSIFDISDMELEGTPCKILTYDPGCDRTDLWVRSKHADGMLDIIIHSCHEAVPREFTQQLLDHLCDAILQFHEKPDEPLPQPSTWAECSLPETPLKTLPEPQNFESVSFESSKYKGLIQRAWQEVLQIGEGLESDVVISHNTPFFDVWGDMLAAQQFAEFYSANINAKILLEDVMEFPTMKGQVVLLEKKENQRI